MNKKWIPTKDQLPPHDEDVQISYDGGETCEGNGKYTERRICMLAGISGGNGYFGEGWATADTDDVDSNLIIDTPTHWRYLPVEGERVDGTNKLVTLDNLVKTFEQFPKVENSKKVLAVHPTTCLLLKDFIVYDQTYFYRCHRVS